MSGEDMDRTVSSNPFIYDQLKILGVGATVWDDVLDEMFDEPYGNISGPFGFVLADLNGKIGPQRLDYSRAEGISDHDYVRGLLRQSMAELSSDPRLPDDDGSGCDAALKEYWADRASMKSTSEAQSFGLLDHGASLSQSSSPVTSSPACGLWLSKASINRVARTSCRSIPIGALLPSDGLFTWRTCESYV